MMDSIRLIDRRFIFIPLLFVLLGIVVYFASFLPTADWYDIFYPAARGVLFGHSPYERIGYICAPWGVLPLIPFVLFPPVAAHGLFFVASALILFYVIWRLGARPLAAAAFLLSPTAIGALLVGNLDPLAISGMLFPPVWGLFILLIKPQIGVGVAIYYLIETWRKSRFWGVVRVLAPITIVYLVSAWLFPVWVERIIHNPQNIWNRSLFPYSIPLGLFFLWLAIRKRNPYFALVATPFLAPYHSFYTYIAVQIGLLHKDVEKVIRRDVLQIILTVFLWVVMLVFHL
jgi:hypothetical protein